MDILAEARRLASVATVFVWVGWFFVIYAIIAGIFWWIDLASREAFNFLEALGISLNAIGGPIFLALIVAGMGHFLRLFALWAASQSREA
jgi:maltodextrin utilization protein YvdJ